MKLLSTIIALALTACGSWSESQHTEIKGSNEYKTVAGVSGDISGSSPERKSVENALRRADIDFIYGDHASRYTQLCCREADVERARKVIREIPPKERAGVILYDVN